MPIRLQPVDTSLKIVHWLRWLFIFTDKRVQKPLHSITDTFFFGRPAQLTNSRVGLAASMIELEALRDTRAPLTRA